MDSKQQAAQKEIWLAAAIMPLCKSEADKEFQNLYSTRYSDADNYFANWVKNSNKRKDNEYFHDDLLSIYCERYSIPKHISETEIWACIGLNLVKERLSLIAKPKRKAGHPRKEMNHGEKRLSLYETVSTFTNEYGERPFATIKPKELFDWIKADQIKISPPPSTIHTRERKRRAYENACTDEYHREVKAWATRWAALHSERAINSISEARKARQQQLTDK